MSLKPSTGQELKKREKLNNWLFHRHPFTELSVWNYGDRQIFTDSFITLVLDGEAFATILGRGTSLPCHPKYEIDFYGGYCLGLFLGFFFSVYNNYTNNSSYPSPWCNSNSRNEKAQNETRVTKIEKVTLAVTLKTANERSIWIPVRNKDKNLKTCCLFLTL